MMLSDARLAPALAALRADEGALDQFLRDFVRAASVFDPDAGTTEEPAARLVHDLLAAWGWSPPCAARCRTTAAA